ncbi:hypothetical protein WR25_00494 isoform C [Diploscapter pachys]|nr:hypothetical protein WR25_00494 isoform C [Diploscapter pachys]
MQSVDKLKEIMAFILNQITPKFDYADGQTIAYMVYGGQGGGLQATEFASNIEQSCSYIETVINGVGNNLTPVTLTTGLNEMKKFYNDTLSSGKRIPILLFTGATDKADIASAAQLAKTNIQNGDLYIFSMNGGDYSPFTDAKLIYNISQDFQNWGGLQRCFNKAACNIVINQGDVADAVTTVAPTSAPLRGPHCTCNYSTVWLDVIYIFDASAATTANGLMELLGKVQTDAQWLNIAKSTDTSASEYHTRVGIIYYDSDATVYAPLGSLTQMDFLSIPTLPFRNDPGTNLEAAINLALNQFNSSAHRIEAKTVIHLLATTYRPGDYQDPTQIAETFKGDGGIMIVYDYIEAHGSVAPELNTIASPGYFTTSSDDTDGSFVLNAFCDANCFCFVGYNAYSQDTGRNLPNQGCYYPVETTNGYTIAENRCKSFNNGYLATVENEDKMRFLWRMFKQPTNFWIGLQYDGSAFKWQDNYALTANDYQPWAPNGKQVQSGQMSGIYAISTGDQNAIKWSTHEPRQGFWFACEVAPCDSEHYCSRQQPNNIIL